MNILYKNFLFLISFFIVLFFFYNDFSIFLKSKVFEKKTKKLLIMLK